MVFLRDANVFSEFAPVDLAGILVILRSLFHNGAVHPQMSSGFPY